MKIILDDFYYKGKHFKRYETEIPNVTDLEDMPEEKITAYICESLDQFLEEESIDERRD